ncbi:MAG: hypothetical protein K2I69_00835 [Muribaculaceae bacterium]|nr:hypothetical protein [Muribaculaceae bacterium]MDE6573775.1 hypothetical protein [Muribaculaceae bacterium]
MKQSNEHLITVKIADVVPFKLPVSESEESLYRYVIGRINEHYDRFHFGPMADSSDVALAKVTLYYATLLYRSTELVKKQNKLLEEFEQRIDQLLAGTD